MTKEGVAEEVVLRLGLKGSLGLQQADRSAKQRKGQSQATEARTSRDAKRLLERKTIPILP